MKIVIHPNYASLGNEIAEIIRGNYTPDKTFCNKRNTVELVTIGQQPMVVKRYKKTNLLTGVIYTFFRKSKACRAYEHGLRLLNEGISTPQPVAYAEKKKYGILTYGYFISEYVDLPTLEATFYDSNADRDQHQRLAQALSEFTLMLHLKGIVPLDYNTSNLLFKKENGQYQFTLIDINRMHFGSIPNLNDSMRAFFQLGTYPPDYTPLLSYYAEQRGFDFEESLFNVIRHRQNRTRLQKLKRFFKKFKR
jgi:hypothetical protein